MNSEKDPPPSVPPEVQGAWQTLQSFFQSVPSAVGSGLGTAASAIGSGATTVADFVQRHPGVAAPLAILPGAALPVVGTIAALTAANVVRRSRAGDDWTSEERANYVLRLPVSLRESIGELAAAQNRSVNHLLTEAAIDILAKYGVPYPKPSVTPEPAPPPPPS